MHGDPPAENVYPREWRALEKLPPPLCFEKSQPQQHGDLATGNAQAYFYELESEFVGWVGDDVITRHVRIGWAQKIQASETVATVNQIS